MNVFGISGQKGHGKDTLARLMQKECESFHITHFAAELKRLSKLIFGLTDAQMHDQDLKEAPLGRPVEMDSFVPYMQSRTGLSIQPCGKIAKTPREVLQFFGTEYVRRARDSYWVDCVLREVHEKVDFVLVPDTRYLNEMEALRRIGGKVIKVQRLGLPEGTDGHTSETEMAKINPDLFLATVTDNFALQTKVAKLISEGRFEEAKKYDYRSIEPALKAFKEGDSSFDFADYVNLELVEAEEVLNYYLKPPTR